MNQHELEKNQSLITIRPIHIQVYEAIDDFWKTRGYAPLLRELSGSVPSAPRTIQRAIADLIARGYIEKTPNKWRNLKPIQHPNIYK